MAIVQTNEASSTLDSLRLRFNKVNLQLKWKQSDSARDARTINILSIDGGGIRTIIPIIFLLELEIRTQRYTSSMFNLMGGTSFGSIVAAGLNFPTWVDETKPKYTSSDLLNLFHRHIKDIFAIKSILPPKYNYERTIKWVRRMQSEPTYNGEGFQIVLDKYFQMRKIDRLIRRTFIPIFDVNRDGTIWVESDNLQTETEGYLVKEAIQASSAAPGHFDSVKNERNEQVMVDGGSLYNNPVRYLIEKAMEDGYQPKDIYVVSMGTGKVSMPAEMSIEEKMAKMAEHDA